MSDQLATALYNSIREANETRTFKMWHASSIAECPRAHYFKRLGVVAPTANDPGAGKMLRWQPPHDEEVSLTPPRTRISRPHSNTRLESEF